MRSTTPAHLALCCVVRTTELRVLSIRPVVPQQPDEIRVVNLHPRKDIP